MINLEQNFNGGYYGGTGIRPVERKIWKVVKPLKPEDELKNIAQTEILEEQPGFTVFRMKRKAEVEPYDLLVIDNIEIASVRKKLQTHHINDLEKTMGNLTIEKSPQQMEEQAQKNPFFESLKFFQPGENNADMTYVLKRIDTSNIFELGEEEFRRYYRTVYNESRTKEKREANISGRRKDLMENLMKEKNAQNQLQLYDVNLKREKKKDVLLLNGKPMIETNVLEMATKKKGDMEEEDAEYDIYYLGKASKAQLSNAPKTILDTPLQSTVQNDLDENDLADDDDSEEDAVCKYNDDNYDSNDEDHPRNDYPDEEAEGLDDYGDNNEQDDDDDEESNYNDYDDDDEDDGRYDWEKEEEQERKKDNFYQDIAHYNDHDFQWPGKKKNDNAIEEEIEWN